MVGGGGAVASVDVDPSFWAARRVLVTGHTGFKGAWLVLWLRAMGAEVVGLANAVPTEPSLYGVAGVGRDIAEVSADIRDHAAVCQALAEHRPEVVIHMAAQSLVRPSFEDPVLTYETNVMGTVNLLDAVRRAGGVRAVVNVTSDKCYDNREWDWGYREYEPKGGHDPYSSSKGCAELVTDAFRRSYFAPEPDGPRLASGRAGNVIGGGDWAPDRLLPDAMRAADAREPIRVRNPRSIRPWQHVLSPLSGYLVLVQALWQSAEYADGWNFGPADEDARPVSWIVERVCELWGEGLEWVADPGPHPHEARYLKLDSSRARQRLGWFPRWDLEQSLGQIVSWHRALDKGRDMREVTIGQIEAFAAGSAATLPRS